MTTRPTQDLQHDSRRPAAPPSRAHRAALEAELLARFRALHPKTEGRTMTHVAGWRIAMVGVLLLAAGGASQAPADVAAEIGRRIEVISEAPLGPEVVRALVAALETGGREYEVRVLGAPLPDGRLATTVEVFGDTVALEEVAGTIRAKVPALAALPITVAPIERPVRGTLGQAAGALVGVDRRLSPAELKAAIAAELEAGAPGARVEVQVEEQEGQRRVRVEVRREVGPGEAAPAAPPQGR